MSDKKKDMSGIIDASLAGIGAAARALEPHIEKMKTQVSMIKDNPNLAKVTEKSAILMALLGLAIVLHGDHFAKILICVSAVRFQGGFGAVAKGFQDLYADMQKGEGKKNDAAADAAPAGTEEEKKTEGEGEATKVNKHAAKREAAKSTTAVANPEDAQRIRKALNAWDTDKFFSAFGGFFVFFLSCIAALQGSLGCAIILAPELADQAVEVMGQFISFGKNDEEAARGAKIGRMLLLPVCGIFSFLLTPVALCLDRAACGAKLVVSHGAKAAEEMGKKDLLSGDKARMVRLGLAGFGSFWQLWSYASGEGLSWYLSFLYPIYLPAYILETILAAF